MKLQNLPLYVIGVLVFLWTAIPIYHLFIIALSPGQEAVASGLVPSTTWCSTSGTSSRRACSSRSWWP
jgi:ABC-type glycerol-3-phosphate transport system permease component